MNEHGTPPHASGWQVFWDRGGWWKALAFAVAYLAIYELAPRLFLPLTASSIDADNPFATPASVFASISLPLIIGAIVLTTFALSVRWIPLPLFGKQPVAGRWWMWIAVVVVLIPIVLRLLGSDYSLYSTGVIVTMFLTGALVGFSEELLTRGVVVTLLRRHGYREWSVAALSSLVFAAAHSLNLFSGQSIVAVGSTMVYTFFFGVLMYLVMRVTGSIIWAMVLHGLTDPTTMLATGGVDSANSGTDNVFLSLVTPATLVLTVAGLILLLFIRGSAEGRAAAGERGLPAPYVRS